MLIIFQALFSLFVIFAILGVVNKKRSGLIGPKGSIFWFLFWLVAGIFVWIPNSATRIALAFGIGRGADLITYTSLAVIFFILFRLNVKIEGLSRGVTKVIRNEAIKEVKKF